MQWIERLRARPEAQRRLMALSVAGGFAAAVFVLWLYTLTTAPPAPSEEPARAGQEEAKADHVSPAMEEQNFFQRSFEALWALVPDTPDIFKERIQFERHFPATN